MFLNFSRFPNSARTFCGTLIFQGVVLISKKLAENKGVNASDIIKELSLLIDGSGGGQTFYATGGGTNLKGISSVISKSSEIVNQM